MTKVGLLEKAGVGGHWSDGTLRVREQNWGRYLSYLSCNGRLDPDVPHSDLLTVENVGGYFVSLKNRLSDGSTRQAAVELSMLAYAFDPTRQWYWIRRHPEVPTAREVKAQKPETKLFSPYELAAAAIADCEAADLVQPPSRVASLRFQDALLVLFTVLTVLRHKNVCEMQVGTHLRCAHGFIRVLFEETVKNGEVIDILLDGALATHMTQHLSVHRLVLLQGGIDHDAVWVSPSGDHMGYSLMYNRYRAATFRLVGEKLTMHSARHTLATEMQRKDPTSLSVVSAALAHRGPATALRSYAHAGSAPALNVWQAMVRKISRG